MSFHFPTIVLGTNLLYRLLARTCRAIAYILHHDPVAVQDLVV